MSWLIQDQIHFCLAVLENLQIFSLIYTEKKRVWFFFFEQRMIKKKGMFRWTEMGREGMGVTKSPLSLSISTYTKRNSGNWLVIYQRIHSTIFIKKKLKNECNTWTICFLTCLCSKDLENIGRVWWDFLFWYFWLICTEANVHSNRHNWDSN